MPDIRTGRLWQTTTGGMLEQNVKIALNYYRGKYDDVFASIEVPGRDWEKLMGMKEVCGLPVKFSDDVPPGHIFFCHGDGKKAAEEE